MNVIDFGYRAGLLAASPWWLARRKSRQKVLGALRERNGQVPQRYGDKPAVLIHGVSLGEINATRTLVQQLEADDSVDLIISTTTATGHDRAKTLYAGQHDVVTFPLDFSASIRRFLDNVRPTVAVLMEGEVWPNFVQACHSRGVPVIIANGRMTTKSLSGYQRLKPLLGGTFARLSAVAVQEQVYAERFVRVGVPPDRVQVLGSLKYDTAAVADTIAGAAELAGLLGVGDAPLIVAGSTGPGEERLVLAAYRQLLDSQPTLRLLIAPRKPERFDDVAKLIRAQHFNLLRRSKPSAAQRSGDAPTVILLDSLGELRKAYALSSAVFVGRSLVDLGPSQRGSDMIEPAALGKPVVVGPYTQNFSDAIKRLAAARAIVEVSTTDELAAALARLMNDSDIGKRAQRVVLDAQGATARHVEMIRAFLPDRPAT